MTSACLSPRRKRMIKKTSPRRKMTSAASPSKYFRGFLSDLHCAAGRGDEFMIIWGHRGSLTFWLFRRWFWFWLQCKLTFPLERRVSKPKAGTRSCPCIYDDMETSNCSCVFVYLYLCICIISKKVNAYTSPQHLRWEPCLSTEQSETIFLAPPPMKDRTIFNIFLAPPLWVGTEYSGPNLLWGID